MANYSPTVGGSADAWADDGARHAGSGGPALATFTNLAGAAVSLSLIVGVAVWGYKLVIRDVSGIPVVRAAEGEMRVRPDDPGGQLARHQGLAVNAIAATGATDAPADELRLAPKPVELAAEDAAPAPVLRIEKPEPLEVAAKLDTGPVTDPVETVLREVMEAEAADADEADSTQLAAVLPADVPGLSNSLRPPVRPAAFSPREAASTTQTATREVAPDSIPAGTRLAQLGAFDSAEIARETWDNLESRFGAYLEDKSRVIQKASSGGRSFYRLRAMGFDDLSESRRFCAALVAEGADCIPVVAR